MHLGWVMAIVALLALGAAAPAARAFSPLPEVTAISPNHGPRLGGASVEITGANFTGATAVKFRTERGYESDAASFTVNSDTSITAVSPPCPSGPEGGVAQIIVVGPGGTSQRSPQDQFGYGPVVDEISPKTGPAGGGTAVTLSGFGLGATTAVNFGASPALGFSVNPDGSITAISPPMPAEGPVLRVTATTPEGQSYSYWPDPDGSPVNRFLYGPSVTTVAPASGPAAGGTAVKIRGTGLGGLPGLGPPPVVYFGSTRLGCQLVNGEFTCPHGEIEVNSGTEITAIAPPGSGTEDVVVETQGGKSPITSADQYVFESQSLGNEAEYRHCLARAQRALRSTRRAAKLRYGRVGRTALRHAKRRHRMAVAVCRARFPHGP